MSHRLLRCGPSAVIAEVDDTPQAIELANWLRLSALPGVVELVPGACTVLVECDGPASLVRVRDTLADYAPGDASAVSTGRIVEVPVTYDGEDLADVADATGLSIA